jgi:hypothetical protein
MAEMAVECADEVTPAMLSEAVGKALHSLKMPEFHLVPAISNTETHIEVMTSTDLIVKQWIDREVETKTENGETMFRIKTPEEAQ